MFRVKGIVLGGRVCLSFIGRGLQNGAYDMHNQATVMSNWSRLQIAQRQTRIERKAFPKQIPNVFARVETLPIRLLKGKRLTALHQHQ